MRIAICDGNRNDAGKIKFALMDLGSELETDCFESGSEFLGRIKSGVAYDIVFIDIYIGDENGMDIVRKMQTISPDTQVIFSTSSPDFAVEAFNVNAVGYLLKPYSEPDVVKAFARANVRRKRPNDNVLIQSGSDRYLLHNDDVISIVSDRHYSRITTKDGKVSSYHISFSEILKLFRGFMVIKRGIALNMSHIRQIKSSVVTMSDGSSYTIARGKKDEVVRSYTAFVLSSDHRI